MSPLSAEPPNALLPAPAGTSTHKLVNSSSKRLAFKVKSSNNDDYRVRPVLGFVEPNAFAVIEVMRLNGKPKEDFLIVQYVEVAASVTKPEEPFDAKQTEGSGEIVIRMIAHSVPAAPLEMLSAKRILRELHSFQTHMPKYVSRFKVKDNNTREWLMLLHPDKEPYKHGAFHLQIEFHSEHPAKPPEVAFLTQIYHPNVDVTGVVCAPFLLLDNWKPSTPVTAVLESVVDLLYHPEAERAVRPDIAAQLKADRQQFLEKAAGEALRYSVKIS